jgi:hypothetical protein
VSTRRASPVATLAADIETVRDQLAAGIDPGGNLAALAAMLEREAQAVRVLLVPRRVEGG